MIDHTLIAKDLTDFPNFGGTPTGRPRERPGCRQAGLHIAHERPSIGFRKTLLTRMMQRSLWCIQKGSATAIVAERGAKSRTKGGMQMTEARDLLARMTLEEKAAFCSGRDFRHLKGIDRLGIPSIMLTDGPHGLRKQTVSGERIDLHASVPTTCFPTATALAATWNRGLVYRVGEALAQECLAEKVAILLGPGANIKRSPLCGRNFEYFSEDPYLTGEMAKAHIQGVTKQRHRDRAQALRGQQSGKPAHVDRRDRRRTGAA